jgi:hypothetical protein
LAPRASFEARRYGARKERKRQNTYLFCPLDLFDEAAAEKPRDFLSVNGLEEELLVEWGALTRVVK